MRYGPNRISICTSTGLKAIYGTNAAAQKARFYKIFGLAFTIPNTLSMIDKNRHAFHRRVLMQSLSGTALKGMEEHILRNSMILCEMLVQGAEEGEGDRDRDGKREGEGEGKEGENGWSSPKNMTGWCSRVTFDVMGDILFGQNWSVLTSATNRGLPAAFRNGAGALSIVRTPSRSLSSPSKPPFSLYQSLPSHSPFDKSSKTLINSFFPVFFVGLDITHALAPAPKTRLDLLPGPHRRRTHLPRRQRRKSQATDRRGESQRRTGHLRVAPKRQRP